MRDSDGNRPPHTFVLRSASFAFHQDPSLPFSRPLRLPRFSFFSLSPSCPNSPPPGPPATADCPLFINAIKETECRASYGRLSTVPMPRARKEGAAGGQPGKGRIQFYASRGSDGTRKGCRCRIHGRTRDSLESVTAISTVTEGTLPVICLSLMVDAWDRGVGRYLSG